MRNLELLTELYEHEITGVFLSDMVSDIISGAKAGNLLVTVQIHKNLIRIYPSLKNYPSLKTMNDSKKAMVEKHILD